MTQTDAVQNAIDAVLDEKVSLPLIAKTNEVNVFVSGKRGLLNVNNVQAVYNSRDDMLQLGRIVGSDNSQIDSLRVTDSDGSLIANIKPVNFTDTDGIWFIEPVTIPNVKDPNVQKVLEKINKDAEQFSTKNVKDAVTNEMIKVTASGFTLTRCKTRKIKTKPPLDVGVDVQECVLHSLWLLYPDLMNRGSSSTPRETKSVIKGKLDAVTEQRIKERQALIDSKEVPMSLIDKVYPDLIEKVTDADSAE